jgi:uncharacterized phage protein (TIGR01671 family)
MNRIIKLKVWDNQGKKFIQDEFAMSWCNGKIINIVGVSYNKHEEDDPYEDVTFCQYTGLKDKKGIEIFEGDFVENELVSGFVVFDSGAFCILIDKLINKNAGYDVGQTPLLADFSQNTIKGNFYENPEL